MAVSEALTLRTHDAFRSQFLPTDRTITVVLPPGYDADPARRYPVLYLHDGQNLFDPDRAYIKGQHWRVGETAQELIEAGRLAPLIIVGIDHAHDGRLHEYTPTGDKRRGGGGGDAYGRLLVEELKPFIDATYRTRPEAAQTGIGGSSLGGLISLYLALKYPHVFTRVAVLSPSVWWDRRVILRYVREARPQPPLRIWVDMGSKEGRPHVTNVRLLKSGLIAAGWRLDDDLHYEEIAGATHSEAAWASRLARVLEFLYPVE